jgi:hypothetical protein
LGKERAGKRNKQRRKKEESGRVEKYAKTKGTQKLPAQ